MRTVLLRYSRAVGATIIIAGLASACSLYFDSHGSNSSGVPDAGGGPTADARESDVDAGDPDQPDGGTGGCSDDGGTQVPPDAQDPEYPADAGEGPADARYDPLPSDGGY
jgi:hypothetical protein